MSATTLLDVLEIVRNSGLADTRRRDLASAVGRICDLAARNSEAIPAHPEQLRRLVNSIRPARYRLTDKTWANIRSNLAAALEVAHVVDGLDRGAARTDARWCPLIALFGKDKRLSCGLASFANWCVREDISPGDVRDEHVQRFYGWLIARTIVPKPKDIARRVPRLWNEASSRFPEWPKNKLEVIGFRPTPIRIAWEAMPNALRVDVEAYIAMRAKPDLFDERPNVPRKPLASTTIRLQRNLLQSAISVLIKDGVAVASLADVVNVEAFKRVLRHYHSKADEKASQYLDSMGRALIGVAKYHARVEAEHLGRLKAIAAKLPKVAFDLTEKNKRLLSELESERLRRNLLFLPDALLRDVIKELECGRVRYVWGQIAIAVDIVLASPIRCENLSTLTWRQHFLEPDGRKGKLILRLAKGETKTGKSDYVAELPADVADHIRWYRSKMWAWFAADPNGDLFVVKGGGRKSQETLSEQITDVIGDRVGVHMTPHQFRHFAAALYLEDHPEDFETVRNMLGHTNARTTSIYAGSSSRRATRTYARLLMEKRSAFKVSKKPRKKDNEEER